MRFDWKPSTRAAGKLTAEVGSEAVVYEVERDRATALNPLGAFLWKNAQGDTSIAELSQRATRELGVQIDPASMYAAAEELVTAALLNPPPQNSGAQVARRDVLKRLAFSAPVVATLVVPPPVAAGSGPPPPGPGPAGLTGISDGSPLPLAGGLIGGAAVPATLLSAACKEDWHPLPLQAYGNRTLEDCQLAGFRWPTVNPASSSHTGFQRVRFAVGNAVVGLAGKTLPRLPQQVSGIPVDRPFDYLYILHTATGRSAHPGDSIGCYMVRYADGDSARIPLQYGLDVVVEGDSQLPDAVLRSRPLGGSGLPVFLSLWKNPRPKEPVTALDFQSAMAPSAPVCLALTVSSCRRRRTPAQHVASA